MTLALSEAIRSESSRSRNPSPTATPATQAISPAEVTTGRLRRSAVFNWRGRKRSVK